MSAPPGGRLHGHRPGARHTVTGDLFDGPAEATAQGLRFTRVGVWLTVFPPLSGALAAGSVGLAGVALAPSLPVAFAAGALVGTGFSVSLTLYRSAITGRADADLRGGLVSLGETTGRVDSTVAPAAMGAAVALLSAGGTSADAVRTVVVAVGVGVVVVGGPLLLVGGGPTGLGTGSGDG